jgi:hypothetical protein
MPDRESSGFPTGLHARQPYRAGSTRKAKSGCCCASLSRETIQTTITGEGWDPRSEEYSSFPDQQLRPREFTVVPACGKPDSSGSHFVAGHGTFRGVLA